MEDEALQEHVNVTSKNGRHVAGAGVSIPLADPNGWFLSYGCMNAWDVLQQLYDSEINGGLSSDWDGGISAWIADGRTRLAERTFLRDEFDQIGNWLDDEARRLFPDSEYARNRFDPPAIPHGDPLWRNVPRRRQSEPPKHRS